MGEGRVRLHRTCTSLSPAVSSLPRLCLALRPRVTRVLLSHRVSIRTVLAVRVPFLLTVI